MLQQNFTTKIDETTANMREEKEAGVEVNVEMGTQKNWARDNSHTWHRKLIVTSGLHLMNKGSVQNICLREKKDFPCLYEDTKKKMYRNLRLVNFDFLSRSQGTIKQWLVEMNILTQ